MLGSHPVLLAFTPTFVGVSPLPYRIAKLLQFVVVVPEDVPALPPGNQAAYLRRLWCHPDQGTPCEVQLIMGKTLERNLVSGLTGKVPQHTARLALLTHNQCKCGRALLYCMRDVIGTLAHLICTPAATAAEQ